MARVTTTIVFQHEDNPLRHLILSSPEQMLINFLECQIEFTGKKMMLSFKNKFIWLCGFEKIVSDTFSSEHEVTGSEDANVYFYDLARPKNSCVNKLQGHGSPVIGVAWNHGENLLASSDSDGTVIVWKRAKTN